LKVDSEGERSRQGGRKERYARLRGKKKRVQ